MKMIDLKEVQVEDIEARLSSYDENHITYKMNGCIQIGVEDDGRLIAGLDAQITAFRILYVSTVFVEEAYRRKGIGAWMIRDTFNWQGKEFYEALDYQCAGHYDNAEDGYSEYFFLKRINGPVSTDAEHPAIRK